MNIANTNTTLQQNFSEFGFGFGSCQSLRISGKKCSKIVTGPDLKITARCATQKKVINNLTI